MRPKESRCVVAPLVRRLLRRHRAAPDDSSVGASVRCERGVRGRPFLRERVGLCETL